MNIQKEELGNSRVQLTVEVEAARLEEAKKQAAKRIGRDINIPGFRKGKAPYHMIVKTVGEAALVEEALQALLPKVAEAAIEQEEVDVYSYQDIEVDVPSLEPLVFQFVIPTMPVVELGDVEGLEVSAESVEISEEKVDEVLDSLREGRAMWEPSTGPAAYGDQSTFDIRMDLMDGSTLADQKGIEILLSEREEGEEEEEGPVGPNLDEQLVGMMVNQVKEFPLAYPEEWPNERVAGRTVLYRATLLDLKKKQIAALDEEFAQELNFESVEALRARVRDNLTREAEEEEFDRVISAILDQLADSSSLEYPQAMVRHEVESRIASLERQIAPYRMNLEQYLEIVGKEREELEDELWDTAEEHLRRSLVLSQYIRDREIEAEPEELQKEITMILSSYDPAEVGEMRDRLLQTPEAMADVINSLMSRKGVRELYERVTGQDAPPLFPEWLDQMDEEAEDEAEVDAAAEDEAEEPVAVEAEDEG